MTRMVVKMAAVSTIAVLLLCCSSVASTDSQKKCDYYVETNKDFTVPLDSTLPELGQLQWKHNNAIIFHRRQSKLTKGVEEDVDQKGSLKLTKVTKNKAGSYAYEVFDGNGQRVGQKSKTLCVMDPVPKPELKTDCQRLTTSVKLTLTCEVAQKPEVLNFEWLQNGKVLENKKDQTLQLEITKDLETASFSCKVFNQVSSLTSASKKHNCIKPGFVFPKDIFGINTWYYVGGGGGVVLLLIILVIVCCIRMRRKKSMQVKDEEELRLGWTNPNQQHHQQQHSHPPNQHHHHHHHQQQPAGHTGPRQHRSKQQRSQQRPRDPAHPNGQPQPSPRRAAQVPRPVNTTDDELPPPLPQPRKKAPKTARV
ncbi:uncharacterized protein [Pagrus major]|uniref:uncharacterized protein n=1 Tax=Pagrus major TaxID=143350 RepID=UPI003CC8B42E